MKTRLRSDSAPDGPGRKQAIRHVQNWGVLQRNRMLRCDPFCPTHDDPEELLQDGLVIALLLLNGTQRSRKNVTAANVAYYATKFLRCGRRSTGFRKADPLHPASNLNGRCRVHSFEERVAIDRSTGEPLTLGEMLPARDDDPATQACRRLDWDQLMQQLDVITKAVLVCLATCEELTSLVSRFRKCRSSLQNHKDRLAGLIKEFMGGDILRQIRIPKTDPLQFIVVFGQITLSLGVVKKGSQHFAVVVLRAGSKAQAAHEPLHSPPPGRSQRPITSDGSHHSLSKRVRMQRQCGTQILSTLSLA